MIKKLFKHSGTVAMAAVVATAMGTGDADAQKIRWKMHAAFGQNVAVIGPPPHRVADAVRRMSGGDFDIKVFEPGALAGGYAYFGPVGQGAFESAWGTSGANQGKNSAYAFLSTWPFGPAAPEFVAWFKYGRLSLPKPSSTSFGGWGNTDLGRVQQHSR